MPISFCKMIVKVVLAGVAAFLCIIVAAVPHALYGKCDVEDSRDCMDGIGVFHITLAGTKQEQSTKSLFAGCSPAPGLVVVMQVAIITAIISCALMGIGTLLSFSGTVRNSCFLFLFDVIAIVSLCLSTAMMFVLFYAEFECDWGFGLKGTIKVSKSVNLSFGPFFMCVAIVLTIINMVIGVMKDGRDDRDYRQHQEMTQ
eukprot:gene831-1278_t